MRSVFALAACVAALAGQPAFAGTHRAVAASNPEMKQIFDADQADRAPGIDKVDWKTVGPRDDARRQRTRQLLAEGKLHTGADFVGAAYVFQHSNATDDFLMAHTLGVVAAAKGDRRGLFIAAASLDRYLQRIGQKQIYGTQTVSQGGPWTMEPYDRDLVSDALRKELTVPPLAVQDAGLEKMKATVATPANFQQSAVPEKLTCDVGPVDKVFLAAVWHLYGCGHGTLMVLGGGEPPASMMANVFDGKVVIGTPPGGRDDVEVKAARAALEAMTPAQFEALVSEIQAVAPRDVK